MAHLFLALAFLLGSGSRVIAESFLPSTPEAYLSPSGNHLIRVEAADSVENPRLYWKHTEFNIFSYNEKVDAYDRVIRFDVEGHPLQLFVNDAGTHIVTIDQRFGVGYGQIAAIYNFEGKRLAEWTLSQLFNIENLYDRQKLPNFRRSTSSIYWRGDASWSRDQKIVRISAPTSVESKDDGTYAVIYPSDMESYLIDINKLEMKRIAPKNNKQNKSEEPTPNPPSD